MVTFITIFKKNLRFFLNSEQAIILYVKSFFILGAWCTIVWVLRCIWESIWSRNLLHLCFPAKLRFHLLTLSSYHNSSCKQLSCFHGSSYLGIRIYAYLRSLSQVDTNVVQKKCRQNRVAEIQTLLPEHNSRHIRSEFNPADISSRGASVDTLFNTPEW